MNSVTNWLIFIFCYLIPFGAIAGAIGWFVRHKLSKINYHEKIALIAGRYGQLAASFVDYGYAHDLDFGSLPRSIDILNYKMLNACFRAVKPDVVINCVGFTNVDKCEDPTNSEAYSVNITGALNLATCAESLNIPFVQISTDYVFDGSKSVPYTELDEPNPINMYGYTKLLAEKLLADITKKLYIVRTSWLFSEFARDSNFLYRFSKLDTTKEIRMVNDQVSTPTFCRDIVPVIFKLIDTGAFGTYHLTNQGYCSKYDWARLIDQASPNPSTIVPCASSEFKGAKRPPFSVLDCCKIIHLLNIPMLQSWEDATVDALSLAEF
jgi:dTDP-4-dehydrorhamnose reductase